jgi:hypothetical protein
VDEWVAAQVGPFHLILAKNLDVSAVSLISFLYQSPTMIFLFDSKSLFHPISYEYNIKNRGLKVRLRKTEAGTFIGIG